MRNDFAIFICTHGRPDKQLTLKTILECGYTGNWYLVVDDTDKTIQQYIDNYGANRIIVFNKNYYINSAKYDNGTNVLMDKCILYAKRAVEDIAKSFNLKAFIIADDDVTGLCIRYPYADKLLRRKIRCLDDVLDAHIELLKCGIAGIGFGTVVDYYAGVDEFSYEKFMRIQKLPYQFILRNADMHIDWISWFAEDDVTEFQYGMTGYPWFKSLYVMYDCLPVGDISVGGGMTDTYRIDNSFYKLNFNAVKHCPQRMLLRSNDKGSMLIHRNFNISFPKILSGRYKRENIV